LRRPRNEENEFTPPKKKINLKDIKRSLGIYRFIRPYQGYLIIGFIFLVLSTLSSLSFPWLIGELINAAMGQSKGFFQTVGQVMTAFGIIIVSQSVFSYFRLYFFTFLTEKASADIRFTLYNKIISLPIGYFDSHRTGELNSRISNDVSQIQDTLSNTVAEFIRQIFTLTIGSVFLLFISAKLTGFMLATFPVLVIAALVFGTFIRKLSKSRQDELAKSNVIVEETLQAVRVVKAFTNELLEITRYRKSLDKTVETSLKAAKYRSAFVSFVIFALFGGIMLVMWRGAILVQDHTIVAGDLLKFMLYTGFIGGSVAGLGELYGQIQKTVGSTERILEILDEPGEISIHENGVSTEKLNGDIVFQDVNFAYPSRKEIEVLKGINLSIPSGAKVALVGPSGSGKSTVTQLMMRYYEADNGEILINGKNIKSLPIETLRKNIGIVPQETILFGGSISENISYGKPGASDEEIRQAAIKANALGFIESFPEGFQTIVGERGIQLSGGQRQRIAIARAILKDPAILILDEATSSLDAESERLVQEALDILMVGRTSLIIAHRLSTVKKADSIFVINSGEIVEMGTHEDLITHHDGIYASLVKMQLS